MLQDLLHAMLKESRVLITAHFLCWLLFSQNNHLKPASALFETRGVRGEPGFKLLLFSSHERLHESAGTASAMALLYTVDAEVGGHEIIAVCNFLS